MIQTEQDLINEADRRRSFELLGVKSEIPPEHTKFGMPEVRAADGNLTRVIRDEIAKQQEARRSGTNRVKSGSN